MANIVDVLIEDPRWDRLGLKPLAEKAARAALRGAGLNPSRYEISLLACNNARIAALNADFRGKPKPTNVLSWPSKERGAVTEGGQPDLPAGRKGEIVELGDIAIAYETCLAEAQSAGRDPSAHVCHLLVHGVLHLLGFDHISDADAAVMERLEVEILETMGLADPY